MMLPFTPLMRTNWNVLYDGREKCDYFKIDYFILLDGIFMYTPECRIDRQQNLAVFQE